MAAKLLHSLADDNPDLQKQIGCMTGIFQLFDRPQMVTGRRLNHKRFPPGDSNFNHNVPERDPLNACQHRYAPVDKSLIEKQRLSTESSRASFSSSCSSMSSLDCNKATQPEASSFDRIIFPETPSRDPNLTHPASSFEGQSLDFRDVVKDSMYREARALSVKTTAREQVPANTVKHKDSPRPFQLSRTVVEGSNRGGSKGKHNMPADFNESLSVLGKLREASWFYNESSDHPRSSCEVRDGSSRTFSKDSSNHLSFESKDTIKSTLKLKELPRLSLDSREISMRLNSDSKLNGLSRYQQHGMDSTEKGAVPELENQKRPSSVVAKLMGLEAMPDSTSTSYTQPGMLKSLQTEAGDSSSRSFRANDVSRTIRDPKSRRSSVKEPTSPRWKNPDLVMKPLSKMPIEPAPWKQMDGSRSSQKTVLKPAKVTAKVQNSFPSVYSEIENRLKDLEFKQSGKDLRALQQILEAMQDKGLLEAKKEHDSDFGSHRDYQPKCPSPKQKLISSCERNQQTGVVNGSSNTVSDSQRTCESQIVIMKPARLIEKSSIPASSISPMDRPPSLHKALSNGHLDSKRRSVSNRTTKDQSPRNSRSRDSVVISSEKTRVKTTKSTPLLKKVQQSSKENTASSSKSYGSVSPRLQQKKLDLEKQPRLPNPPSDSNKQRRQTNRQSMDSSSPCGKHKLKLHKVPPSDDQLSQMSNDSRNSSLQGDDSSLQSDNTVVFNPKTDLEVTSSEHPTEINVGESPLTKASDNVSSCSEKKVLSSKLDADGTSTSELNSVTPEHPSPVSVLDSSLYGDDALSPVRQSLSVAKGADDQGCASQQSEDEWNSEDNFTSKPILSGQSLEISRKKLQNIDNLVRKLQQLNSTHDEASTDYIASLCENTDPDNRYISEILLASGLLLRDLGSGLTTFQLHKSGHPINPELFFVLEQTKTCNLLSNKDCNGKSSNSKSNPEKLHRKLIFDIVNEILGEKLSLVSVCLEPCVKSSKLAKKNLNAQKLLKELCAEIEQLQVTKQDDEEDGLKIMLVEDVMHQSESWTDFQRELSSIVLDVERLIVKGLIDEVVIGEATALRKVTNRRRQLFAK